MRHEMTRATLAVAMLFAVAAPAHANLVLNPGFETGNLTSWVQGGAGIGVSGGGAHSGSYKTQISSFTPMPTSFLQNLTTTSGEDYSVSFYVKMPGGGGPTFSALWNGVTLGSVTGPMAPDWTRFSFVVVGTGSDTLTFRMAGSGTVHVDDVIVVDPTPPPPPPVNRFLNPGFETGNLTSWIHGGPGMTVSGGGAHTGSYKHEVSNFSGMPTSFAQNLSTTSGENYTLNYYAMQPSGGTVNWSTRWNGVVVDTVSTTALPDWTQFSLDVVGTGADTFEITTTSPGTYWFDDFSLFAEVTEVPEPATIAIFCLGLAGLAAARRHR